MKKVTALVIASLALSACGTKTIVKEVSPAPTSPPITKPATNKYDDYVGFVRNNSGQGYTASTSEIVEAGDLVCSALDSGRSVQSVAKMMEELANTASDIEVYAAVLFGAVQYLCPEYYIQMSEYLASA